MDYFKTADPEDMSQGDLSARIHFLKCEEGGYPDWRRKVLFFRITDDKILTLDEYWADDGTAPQWRLEKHIRHPIN